MAAAARSGGGAQRPAARNYSKTNTHNTTKQKT
jgi:hypothetical protein